MFLSLSALKALLILAKHFLHSKRYDVPASSFFSPSNCVHVSSSQTLTNVSVRLQNTLFCMTAVLRNIDVDGAGVWQWTNINWVTRARSPFAHTLYIYIYTLRDILCSGLADLFTSWFIFIMVICHRPDGLVSEAHIINHGGHYCSIITLSLSEPATFPACALSISVYNTNTHTVGM